MNDLELSKELNSLWIFYSFFGYHFFCQSVEDKKIYIQFLKHPIPVNMSSHFIATASNSFDLSDESPVHCGRPFETSVFGNLSEESLEPRVRPFETLDGFERGEPAPRSETRTNKEFYNYVKRYTKDQKISFKRSPAVTTATKSCLKTWFNIESLTKKQTESAKNFAKKVPYWYISSKNDERLFRSHSGMYQTLLII